MKKQTYLYISFFLIFFVLLTFFFYQEKMVLDSFFELVVEPSSTYKSLWHSWYSLSYFGNDNSAVQSYIFPFGFLYWVLSLCLTTQLSQALLFSFLTTFAYVSFTLFIREEIGNDEPMILVGGLSYALNMYTIITFGTSVFLLPYAVLPLQLYLLRRIFYSANPSLYVILMGISTVLMSGVNPPLIAISLLVITAYLIHLLFIRQKRPRISFIIVNLAKVSLISFALNAYWTVCTIIYYATLNKSNFNAILSEPLSIQNVSSSFLNVFRSLGIWSFGQGWNDQPYYSYAGTYLNSLFFKFSLFALPLLSILGFLRLHKSRRKYLTFIVLLLISIAMAVGSNQGLLRNIYTWSYTHVPLFSMFRSSHKFVSIYVFCISIFTTIFLVNIRNIKLKVALSAMVTVVILMNAFPFFTHSLFDNNKKISGIPDYYYDAKEFFSRDQTIHRIVLLPEQYFATYDWGFTAGNPEIIWGKGLVTRTAGSGLLAHNDLSMKLWRALHKRDPAIVSRQLNQLNASYIVQRNDFDWKFYSKESHSPKQIASILAGYQKIISYGKLDIYKVPNADTHALIRSENVSFMKVSNTKYKLYIKNLSEKQTLDFLESYSDKWHLYLREAPKSDWCVRQAEYQVPYTIECRHSDNFFDLQNLAILFDRSIFDEQHTYVYGYGNRWIIDPAYIIKHYPSNHYVKNPDGSIDIEITLHYKMQSYFYIGLLITLSAILFIVGYCLIKVKNRTQTFRQDN